MEEKEIKAEKKLFKIRDQMNAEDDTLVTGSFYEKKEKLMKSDLNDAFDIMPKTVVHHIHLTASCSVDFLVNKLCYYDFVYFNQKEGLFKVNNSQDFVPPPGFVKVNELR